MNAKLDALDAELVAALAAEPRRTRTTKDSATLQAARLLAAEAKAQAADAALYASQLEASDWRADNYAANMARMATIQKDIKRLQKVCAEGDMLTGPIAAQSIESLRVELSVLYGLPIAGADLLESGRFAASVRYHHREVGMMAADALDVVMEAVALCYLREGDHTTITRFSRGWGYKLTDTFEVPTIGGMYRNLKRASNMLIDQSRRMIRQGLTVQYSLDELAESAESVSDRVRSWGFDYVDSSASGFDALMTVPDAEADALAKADARREAKREAERARLELFEREEAARVVSGTDGVILRMIVNGATVDECAEKLGITRAALTRRLLALEPAGTRWTRTAEYSLEGEGYERVVSKAETRKGWTHAAGTYASPVVTTVR